MEIFQSAHEKCLRQDYDYIESQCFCGGFFFSVLGFCLDFFLVFLQMRKKYGNVFRKKKNQNNNPPPPQQNHSYCNSIILLLLF